MPEPGVQSVDRALDLLESLEPGTPLGVSDLARRARLPTGTAHRLLGTLVARGYVRRDDNRRYSPGPAAFRLADRARRDLANLARGHLVRAVAATGETANLAVLEGSAMVYVAQVPSPHTLRIFAEVGRRVPLHSTAVGKAVLAALPETELERRTAALELTRQTPTTLTNRTGLLAALEQVRTHGYALDDEEQETGVRCAAVALPAAAGVRGAVSVSGPSERFTRSAARRAAEALKDVAAAIALDVGTRPADAPDDADPPTQHTLA